MYWLDGFTFDDNLINNSFLSADSNGELSDNNHHRLSKASSSSANANSNFRISNRKTQSLRGYSAVTKTKRRRHAHYKLNTRLDRKSSRGMIYENEELRLRTININAEVERGQTDIKRLRKENEQLRREIWTLRDECDRLNKRVKAKFIEHEQGVYSVRCSGNNGCPCQYNDVGDGCDGVHSECNSEDSDSCDSCCCREEDVSPCTDECCSENKQTSNNAEIGDTSTVPSQNENIANNEASNTVVGKLPSFDHLSVVSEETLSNSEVVSAQQAENKLHLNPEIGGSQATLPSLIGPLTPLTPVELVANELNDLQSVAPPLSYFENILQHNMSTNYGCTPESSSMSTSDKAAVKYTNGWDYKLESPFGQSQYQNNSISPIMTKRLSAQTLTTFVPNTCTAPLSTAAIETSKGKPALPKKPTDFSVKSHQHFIETVPIKTLPSAEARTQRTEIKSNIGDTTPKNFFSLIKPKLKLNTALANQKRIAPPRPSVKEPSEAVTQVTQLKCQPPDIYVTNALATPYKPPKKLVVQPPLVPQRITSTSTTKAQVSSSQHQRNRQQQSHHRSRQHQVCRYQHQKPNNVVVGNNDVYVLPVIYTTNPSVTATSTKTITTITTTAITNSTNSLCSGMKININDFYPPLKATATTALLSNTFCNTINPLLTTLITTAHVSSSSAATTFTMAYALTSTKCPSACFKFINSNINFRKPNDPVYAIAQNVCHNLITASAVTQPLMSSIVKCCIAKQQQLQQNQHIATASSPSQTEAFHTTAAVVAAADDAGSIGVTMPSPASVQTMEPSSALSSSSMAKLSSVSCSLTINSSLQISITAALTMSTTSTNFIVVDSMCQTDSANLESILNDIEAISEDILAIQLEKSKARDNSDSTSTDAIKKIEQLPLQQDNKNSKPYRSEMNLLLSYDCDNPTISQAKIAVTADTTTITEPMSNAYTIRRARSLERDHTDSPSPHIPDAMKPFPENHKYIGFDRINKAAVIANATSPVVAATATQTLPVLNSPVSQRAHLPLSPLVTNGNTQKSSSAKQLPPAPPTRSYPTALNIKCAGIARSSSTTSCLQSTDLSTNSPGPSRVSPNKSQLYTALANAAAKRAQFRSQPTHLTRTFDAETPTNVKRDCDNYMSDEKALENINTRRVSIIGCDSDKIGLGEKSTTSLRNQIALHPTTGGSCTDLQDIMSNPSLRNLKQTSQSTPNSPHSSRKYENSALPTSPVPPIISITPNSTLQQQCSSSNASAITQLLAHNHAHSHSYPNVISPLTQQQRQRKNSHDVIRAGAAEIACAAANVMRSKCSRRHSDSTVSHANQRVSGISGATNGTHHHHLHSHHHRQHSSSLASNIHPHLNHHSRRDSNQETVASFSDRNSNSLASSRESSASFSMRSQRRKLSVSSHTGGKIPWCGCWGNGCL